MPACARASPFTATPASEADALEAAVAEVAVEEVRVRVVGHEEIDPPVVVVVGGDHAEAVGPRGIGEPVRPRWRRRSVPLPEVLEEQVGLAGQSGRADHDARPVAPDERPLRAARPRPSVVST